MKDLSQVLIRPIVTEKTTDMSGQGNKFVFQVALDSNKVEIRQAVEKFFGVKVLDVRTMRMTGKPKRVRLVTGRRPDWKKAIVTLAEGEVIDVFEGV